MKPATLEGIKVTYFLILTILCVVVQGCAPPYEGGYDAERSAELWAEYNALGRTEHSAFMRNLTADDLFVFLVAAISAYARENFKGSELDFSDVRVEETLGMFGGDDFEDWGERRLADGRRLTASSITNLLEDPELPAEWRSAFRGYLRIIFFANPGQPPSDAYQIGLTDKDIDTLKAYLKKTSKGDPQQMH